MANRSFQISFLWLFILTALFFLFNAQGARAQTALIEGRVVLETSENNLTDVTIGGYQSFSSGTANETDAASGGVLIWLEDKNQGQVYQTEESSENLQVLDQVDKRFSPRLIAVRIGESVRIKNSDPVYHNVFSLSKTKRFDVGRRSPKDYEDVLFDKVGIVDVFCDIHHSLHHGNRGAM